MSQLKCDVCGGEIVRDTDGEFRCRACGCVYSVDMVREMYRKAAEPEVRPIELINGEFEIVHGVLVNYRGSSKNIVVPEGVTIIGEACFKDFSGKKRGIESIRLPEGLIEIGSEAFAHCRYMKDINIPSTVQKIGKEAFALCTAIEKLTIPESVFYIGERAFFRCEALKDLTFNASVAVIKKETFSDCWRLNDLKLPAAVREIQKKAFWGCGTFHPWRGLFKISFTLPENIKTIDDDAFWLAELLVPDNVDRLVWDNGHGHLRYLCRK